MTQAAQKTSVAEMPQHSLIKTMAGKYGLEANTFKATVIKTLFPSDKQNPSNEQVAAFLVVANQYNLNPFVKEIYAFPGKGGGIVPIVSIDGWNTIINRQPMYDGVEFVDEIGKDGSLIAITAKIFRKDRSHPTMVTEYLHECVKNTEPWKQFPARMLRHKALIQAARYAFGLAGIYDPDEAERIAASNGDDLTPTPIAVISEEQRTALVAAAQRFRVIERLGQIVNAAGFEMLAHITVDKYEEVAQAIVDAGTADDPDVQHVDAVIIEDNGPDSGEQAEPVAAEPISKAESKRLEWLTMVDEKIRELTKGDVGKITALLGDRVPKDMTTGQLKDLYAELEKKG